MDDGGERIPLDPSSSSYVLVWVVAVTLAAAALAFGVFAVARTPSRGAAGFALIGLGFGLVVSQRSGRALAIWCRAGNREPALVLGRTDLEVHDRTLFSAPQVIPGHLVAGVERAPAMAAPLVTLAERPPAFFLRLRQPMTLAAARGLPGFTMHGYSLPATVGPRTQVPRLGFVVADADEAVARIERWLAEREPSGSQALPEPPPPCMGRLAIIAIGWIIGLIGGALVVL